MKQAILQGVEPQMTACLVKAYAFWLKDNIDKVTDEILCREEGIIQIINGWQERSPQILAYISKLLKDCLAAALHVPIVLPNCLRCSVMFRSEIQQY